MKLAIDADSICYVGAFVCEERSILATHKATGKTKQFKNKTELLQKVTPKGFKEDDFEIQEQQELKPDANLEKTIDLILKNILKKCNYNELFDEYTCYVGQGQTFRHNQATLIEYKGNRKAPKPLLLAAAKEYFVRKHNGIVVTEMEADDAVQIEGVQGYFNWKQTESEEDKVIVVSIDKDAKRGPLWLFNPDKDTQPRLIEGFGELSLDSKGRVDGFGRVFGYFQILYGDPVDNYFCASATGKKRVWGPKAAYEALKDCKTDAEALQVIVDTYKKLYPAPKEYTNWKGDTFTIDWLYVLKENFRMAIMLIEEDKTPDVEKVLKRYGVLT